MQNEKATSGRVWPLFVRGGDFDFARGCCREWIASGAKGSSGEVCWFQAGCGEPIGLNSAEVEGEAGDASKDASGCRLTTTYPGRRKGRGQVIKYLFPLYRNAWREVLGR